MAAQHERTKKYLSLRVAYEDADIRERGEGRCYICGQRTHRPSKGVDPKKIRVLEHIVPLSLGGDDAPWNVRNACRACDTAKAADASKVNIFALLPDYEIPPEPKVIEYLPDPRSRMPKKKKAPTPPKKKKAPALYQHAKPWTPPLHPDPKVAERLELEAEDEELLRHRPASGPKPYIEVSAITSREDLRRWWNRNVT